MTNEPLCKTDITWVCDAFHVAFVGRSALVFGQKPIMAKSALSVSAGGMELGEEGEEG